MSDHTGQSRPKIILLAGFGDNAHMFDRLFDTELPSHFQLLPINLPGFGTPALSGITTLQHLAEHVGSIALQEEAHIIVAHSVASIIASLVAKQHPNQIDQVISLEGNLTADDAYFSGMAADYDTPADFRAAFLQQLDAMAERNKDVVRYRDAVAQADPDALWQLGCDARRFSDENVPGELLLAAKDVLYVYNPDNCPASSLSWLQTHPMPVILVPGASHAIPVDQPDVLAKIIIDHVRE
ncbi:MAG: alpha/beta fold hydrolase [Anaerolineaceae bacterium]|nr:alpha/beta fold hydrolase [Anaerolineaceae bacterium]